jgi:hypothetical protein
MLFSALVLAWVATFLAICAVRTPWMVVVGVLSGLTPNTPK